MKKVLAIFFGVILLTGCNSQTKEVTLTMNCNGSTTDITIKEKDKLSCELLNTEYEFTITEITDDSITISTESDGISSGAGILDSEKEWTIKKGEKVNIHTNSTDYQEEVEFNW